MQNENACGRAESYIRGVSAAINDVHGRLTNAAFQRSGLDITRLLDAVQRYLDDARYFLGIGDCETALVAVSYAEGLLDSLGYLGITDIPWGKPYRHVKVFVAGTFDLIHPGHIDLLRYASSLGSVYVIVSRDSNAQKSKRRPLVFNEDARLKLISAIKYVYRARLGDKQDILKPVEEIRPDIIVLGPDQPFDEDKLASRLESRLGYRPAIVRYREKSQFAEGMRGSSDVIRDICQRICPSMRSGTLRQSQQT